ncbi:MAG: DUF2079 domain-containing protein [Candidatus Omnitrophica bacterium]|nr:DUF2079 domain-containing protein [Candidatus Omnitrophota bacterium]
MPNHKKDGCLLILIALSFLYGTVFFVLKYLQYKSFFSFEWDDDASYIQLAYNTLRGAFLQQTIFIAKCCYGRFTPFAAVMSVFYRLIPHPPVWFFVTSFTYGFSSIFLYLLGKKVLKDNYLAFIISAAFLFYGPLHYANLGTIETKSLSLFFLMGAFYFLTVKRGALYAVFLALAVSTKQDIALISICFGLYALWNKYPKKWWLTTIALSIIYFLLANFLKNTVFYAQGVDSHPDRHIYARYDLATAGAVLKFFFSKPLEFFGFMFFGSHIRATVLILYPLLFIPLLSLEFYLALPMFAELYLMRGVQNYNSEYVAAIGAFLFIGLIFFLKNISSGVKRKFALALACVVLLVCICSNFYRNIIGDGPDETLIDKKNFVDKSFADVKNIFDKRIYIESREDKLAWKFISLIPDNASVTASGDLLTPLAARRYLYSFGLNEPRAWESEYGPNDYYPAYESDFILIHTKNICNGLGGQYAFVDKPLAQEIIGNKLLTAHNYEIIKEKGDFILLKKKNIAFLGVIDF